MIDNIVNKTGITRRHLHYLLNAERNAAPETAKRLFRATGIAKEVWIFGTKAQRQTAWTKFVKAQKKAR